MSDSDEMGSSSRVPIVRHACAPEVTSCHVWHQMASLPKGPGSGVTCSVSGIPRCGYWGPRHMLS
jgi:hypothetical protein